LKIATVKFERVDGGQFDSLEPSRIPKNGWARSFNFLPYHSRMNRRPGSAAFSKTTPTLGGVANAVSVCVPVKDLVGAAAGYDDWALLALTEKFDAALIKPSGVWGTKLTQLPGGSVQADAMPPFVRQRNGIVYAVRRNAGGMKRIEGNEWTNAGRPTPGAGAAAAWAASGSLSANARRVAYTYYDSQTTYEGNGIEIAVTGTPTINYKIAVTSLQPASADVKWTHYRVYMTQADGGIFYPVALVAKASNAVDLTADSSSAETLSSKNGLPDSGAIGCEIWNERGWLITPKDLFYSPIAKVESYSPAQNLPFNPDDNDEMVVVYGWGDSLVVGRRRSLVLLEGVDRTSWNQRLWTESAGCVAPHSMRDCEGELVWLSEDGFCTATAGTAPTLASSVTVKAALAQMDPARRDLVVAETLPDLSLYVASFPRLDGSWGGVAYNWKSKAWAEFEFPARPRWLHTGFDTTGAVRVFAVMSTSSQPHVVFEGRNDDGSAIESELISGAPDTGGPKLSGIKSVALLCASTRSPVTVSVYREGNTATAACSRTTSLRGDAGWKRVPVGGLQKLGSQLQVGIHYQGDDDFWVADMAWEVGVTERERARY
jgi:hypothetical protein